MNAFCENTTVLTESNLIITYKCSRSLLPVERTKMIAKQRKMIYLHGFRSFNAFAGLAEPLATEIDAGTYEPGKLLYHTEPLVADFYRISVSTVLTECNAVGQVHEVALSSPNIPIRWDQTAGLEGLYLQISPKLMNEHCYHFKKPVPDHPVQRLYLSGSESEEIRILSVSLVKHLKTKGGNDSVSLSYVHVLLSLIDSVYQRQTEQSKTMNFKWIFKGAMAFLSAINKDITGCLRVSNILKPKS